MMGVPSRLKPPGAGYDVLRSVADARPRDHRPPVMKWFARPGAALPVPAPPSGDPFDLDDEHGGWRPVA